MSLHEPAATRPRKATPTIASAAGHVAVPRAPERTSVPDLLEQYEALVDANGPDDAKHALAQRICALLAAPSGRERIGAAAVDRVGRSTFDDGERHVATAQELIERIRSMEPEDRSTAR